MYNKIKIRDGGKMIGANIDFIMNLAVENSKNRKYFEQIYSNLVSDFLQKFVDFYRKNKKILEYWLKNDDEKVKIFSFFFELLKTITFNEDETFTIHYNKLKKFRRMENETEKLNYLRITTEIILDLIKKSNGKFDSQEFKDLNNLAQEIIGFIIDENERVLSILYNLKELNTKIEGEKIEVWYWNKVDNIKTNFINTRTLKI